MRRGYIRSASFQFDCAEHASNDQVLRRDLVQLAQQQGGLRLAALPMERERLPDSSGLMRV
jgi:hypothetical protein